jgi:aminoglycoside 6'-N-acetyltransferase
MELRTHDVVLRSGRIVLRPMTERDWPHLLRWNRRADVLRYVEGDPDARYDLAAVQALYRQVSFDAFCFIIKCGQPVGWCWLQRMNLGRIVDAYPDDDCRRIDLALGEPALWGHGIGTAAIAMLTAFAFRDGADRVFGCDVAAFNERSLRAFGRCGYREVGRYADETGREAGERIDLMSAR